MTQKPVEEIALKYMCSREVAERISELEKEVERLKAVNHD